ncbi:MAG: ATP-dependent RNA helicase RhlE [Hyphomicrobiaceae bacterium]
MNDFTSLGLSAPLLAALEQAGYTTPTPIQSKAIPTLLQGRDLVGIAQTGTGKTAAFALPILHQLAADPKPAPRGGCRVLVLSPTRELATQIGDSFRTYAAKLNVSVTTVFGGVSHRPQIQALGRGVDVLVATPGRLLDHMSTGKANIGATEILVLDEADQMLDLGFLKPIRQIVGRLPKERQTLLFSATMPEQIARLAKDFLHNPERVSVAPVASTAERVSQRVVHIDAAQKRHLLAKLFAEHEMSRTLVFTRTKHGADRLTKHLQAGGVTVAAIHGNKSQPQRERALESFRDSKIQVLVATDIAARGIDIDDVTHVVNYELPEVPEAYVHRIGRTARAGASGSAISFCDDSELKYLRGIERLTRQKIPSETYRNGEAVPDRAVSGYDPIATADAERETRAKRHRHQPSSHRAQNGNRSSDAQPARKETSSAKPQGKARPHRGQAQGAAKSSKPQPNANAGRNGSGRNAKPGNGPSNGNAPRPGRRTSGRRQGNPAATAV